MSIRLATIVIGILDALGCVVIAVATFNSGSDPATIGFDHAAGGSVAAVFLLTGFPSLVLALLGRAPRTALSLALAFPALFALLFIAAVIVFTR
jgi:hypothetical protein